MSCETRSVLVRWKRIWLRVGVMINSIGSVWSLLIRLSSARARAGMITLVGLVQVDVKVSPGHGQAKPVGRSQREFSLVELGENAGKDGAALVGRGGKGCLIDHAAEGIRIEM